MAEVPKTIVVKIGTYVITHEGGELAADVMRDLVRQVVELKRNGTRVILVTSGAVGAGLGLVKIKQGTSAVERRQILASVGQPRLLAAYLEQFRKHQTLCAQVLATKEDFRDRQHYLNMKRCFTALLRDDIVPIVNENDVVAVSEHMFTDNDELAALIAAMMNVDALLILTNVDGVFDEQGKVVSVVDASTALDHIGCALPSKGGRGGMFTKCKAARKVASLGVPTTIVNGKRPNILLDVVAGVSVGTRFAPKKRMSSMKQWIATAPAEEKGTVTINAGAAAALRQGARATSLLPIGIVSVSGEFAKGDLLKIIDEHGKEIGVGIAQYGATAARAAAGKHGKKALIHYDYLSLEV